MTDHLLTHRLEREYLWIGFAAQLDGETIVEVLDIQVLEQPDSASPVDRTEHFVDRVAPNAPAVDGEGVGFWKIEATASTQPRTEAGRKYAVFARVRLGNGRRVVAKDKNGRLPQLIVVDGGKPAS